MRRTATAAVFAMVAAVASSASAQGDAPRDGASMRVRAQEIRTRNDEIKESLRRLQVRLQLAEAQAGLTQVNAARLEIDVDDVMSRAFVLTGVRVWIDDQLVYQRDDETGALAAAPIAAFAGPFVPGDHTVRVSLRLAGNGAILPYMSAYRFEVTSTHALRVAADGSARVTVRAYERGDATTPFEQRPAIEWREATPAK